MNEFTVLTYESGATVLQLQVMPEGEVNYYFNGVFVNRFESLESAFSTIHGQETWSDPTGTPPRERKDWAIEWRRDTDRW